MAASNIKGSAGGGASNQHGMFDFNPASCKSLNVLLLYVVSNLLGNQGSGVSPIQQIIDAIQKSYNTQN
jgi:hypothetical protein